MLNMSLKQGIANLLCETIHIGIVLIRMTRIRRNKHHLLLLLIMILNVLSACKGVTSVDERAPRMETRLQGLKGRIAFTSSGNIFSINADGTELTQLTQGGGPSWSPDGSQVVFTRGNLGSANIYTINADGSNAIQRTTSGGIALSWSPDGKLISYTSGQLHREDLNVMNVDGSQQRQLAMEGGYWSVWSPSGGQIAFRCHDVKICVSNADGSNLRLLAAMNGGSPNWSPDGTNIAFATDDGIYIIHSDGTGLKKLAHPASNEDYPVWSPDGTRIAFVAKPQAGFDSDVPYGYGIYIMKADGSTISRLTKYEDLEVTGKPVWSPDGLSIAFVAWPKGKSSGGKAIYIVMTDGSAMAQLVRDGKNPVWQPRSILVP
jgi:Tol biopolymer transport system component